MLTESGNGRTFEQVETLRAGESRELGVGELLDELWLLVVAVLDRVLYMLDLYAIVSGGGVDS